MSTKKIIVNSKEYIQKFIINNIEIRIIDLNFGVSVDIACTTKQDDKPTKTILLHISGKEYNDWGSNDTYIEDLVLKKLGLTRKQ